MSPSSTSTRKKSAERKPAGAKSAVRKPAGAKSAERKPAVASSQRSVLLQRLGIAAFVALAAAALLWVPSRGYVSQKQEISASRAELTDLKRQNQELLKRRDRLDDPGEIQRIARRDFGLVLEGEESYSILPPASAGLVLPQSWPFNRVKEPLEKASLGPS
ncbi:MAG: septum formation initiator family protein [Microthrixaceae bacterium]